MIDDVGISSRLFTERNKMCFSASITGADPLSSVGSFYLPCMGERRPSSRLLSSHHRRRVRQVGRARRGEGRGRNFARRASIMLGQNVFWPIAKARSTSASRRYHAAPLASAPERRSSRRDLSGRRDARIRSSLGKVLFVGKCTAPDVPRCTRNVSDGTSAVKKELGSIVAAPISARSGNGCREIHRRWPSIEFGV